MRDSLYPRALSSPLIISLVSFLALGCAGSRHAAGDDAVGLSRDARLLAMLDTRGQDTLLIDEVLGDASSSRRARGALAVGQLRMRERYRTLHGLVGDPDTTVAANAAFALGLARDTGAVEYLVRAVLDAPEGVAREAAWALGMIGDPSAVAGLLAGSSDTQRVDSPLAARPATVRSELLLGTARIRGFPAALVIPWLADEDHAVVEGAAYSLSRTRSAAAVRPMMALASHPDELVRQHVARMLDRGITGDSLAGDARRLLDVLLGDASPRVRINAVRSATSYGPEAHAIVQRAMRDSDVNVHVAALDNIAGVLGNEAPAWRTVWDADTSFVTRSTLMQAARRSGTDALASYELVWRRHRDWKLRKAAASLSAQALAGMSGKERVAAMEWALSDGDGRVRAAGLQALVAGVQLQRDSTVAAVVRSSLADDDEQVRSTAASAIGRLGDARDIPQLIETHRRALEDRDGSARNAAIRAIAQIWARDSAGFSAGDVERLSKLPPPADPIDRRAAGALSPLSSWREAGNSRTPKPMAEYERIARRFLAPDAEPAYLTIKTERGDIRLMLYGADAPLTVDRYLTLAREGYYRNTVFHRVVPNFVAQDGDPRGDGTGGGGFYLRDEHNRRRHERGCLGVATSGAETGGSQYYMCHSPQPHLDGGYTVFGKVVSGLDVLDKIVQGDRVFSIEAR